MSTPANPRRWFQIHLSTGIALMFVAGGLVWLNLAWQPFVHDPAQGGLGWPHLMYVRYFGLEHMQLIFVNQWFPIAILLNVSTAFLFLVSTVFVLERRIRRAKSKLTPSRDDAK